ncbi:hypothetical protein [Sphingomonas oryzagri]|uniref:Uncharacterized protein n=1 Tax=Sphingomonas oryzagri TaxID=3042314 RepID=A0ABT6MYG3_9SPHN|nr:hypothetical protein [Sphingomonas oryzagri]MDH7638100.1 hypothetical protein [Sphingomonas oryzagri]
MKDIFSYRASQSDDGVYPTWKVVFTPADTLPLPTLYTDMAADIDRHLLPTALLIIVRDDVFDHAKKQIQASGHASDDWRIDTNTVPLVLLGLDRRGKCARTVRIGKAAAPTIDEDLFASLLHQGLREIFVRRGALIRAEDGQHFVHPSGKHSQAFIRAANVFVDGPETMFVAACLLACVPEQTRDLWIDTSSIASVAHAFALLRHLLAPDLPIPTISSFSSWRAISQEQSIPRTPHRAALVSATTSGNLARRLVSDQGFRADEVVTLFSFAKAGTPPIVCDLSADKVFWAGAEPMVSAEYREGKCALCDAQSRPIRFVGDQFLADSVCYEPIAILRDDAPKSLREFMQNYHGHEGFGLRAVDDDGDTFRQVGIDPARLLAVDRFQTRFKAAVHRHAPRHLTALVHLDDEASGKLAAEFLKVSDNHDTSPIAAQDLRSLAKSGALDGGIVVIAGSVGQGHDLDGISRDLRDPFGETPRTYIIGFSKHSHTDRSKQLVNNLKFNSLSASGQGYEHVVRPIESLILPDRPARSAWEAEFKLLSLLLEDATDAGDSRETDFLDARLDRLRETGSLAVEELFLSSPDGHPLELRDTFAFWKRDLYRSVSQGDVVFTMASVLENLRYGDAPKLVSDSFTQRVIDPGMFGRYNDGVIQASLLRCALPQELYYASMPQLSRQMADLVKRTFVAKPPANEGSLEFLLAIALGRLRLTASDTREVVDASVHLPYPAAALRKRILETPPDELALVRPTGARKSL